MAGALLRTGSIKDFSALGAVGNPVYSAASQLRVAMRRQLGEQVADLFAAPKQDEKGDTIDWYAPFEGGVVPWTAATDEERKGAKAALDAARVRIEERSRKLQAASDSEQQIFGKLLALIMKIPSEEHIYLVEDRPVLTFWGFTERDAPSDSDVISGLRIGRGAVVPTGAAVGPVPETAVTAAGAVLAPVAATAVKRSFWWWLLPLLLLLLLALLLFGLRGCRHELATTFGWSWLIEEEPPVIDVVPPDRVPVEEDDVQLGPGGDVHVGPGGDVHLGTGGKVIGPGEGVPGVGVGDGTAGPGEGEPDVGPEGEEAPGAPPPEPPVSDQPAEPTDEPTADKPPTEAPPKTPPPEPGPIPPPDRPPTSGPVPSGSPLVIPPEAAKTGSTDFLNGQWRSITGLQDKQGNPIQLQYDFKEGQGQATLQRSVGGREQSCEAPVQSKLEGGKLRIQQSSIRCPDGTVFNPSSVECSTDPSGHAICLGQNQDGSHYGVKIVKD